MQKKLLLAQINLLEKPGQISLQKAYPIRDNELDINRRPIL